MMDSFFFGGGFEMVFFLIFGVIAVMILVTLFRGLSQWNKNNHSPRLTVEARVVTKRQNISRHHSGDHMSTTVLCHLPGGKRRPDGASDDGTGIRHAGRGRPGTADVPGHPLCEL